MSAPPPDPIVPAGTLPPLPTSPETLLARLDALGVANRTVTHPPVFTVEESRALRGELPGGHCKNLFLKDAKDRLWLVVALEETPVDLKGLPAAMGSARVSFGRPDLLFEVLGVRPGSVTPFAAINDTAGRVTVVLERAMLAHDPLNYHPLVNDRTTAVSPDGLVAFLRATGHQPLVVDLPRRAG
ncbi:MAG: prolyl-tRNA synthetase associated domain-containing protein [Rhodospirillales bacterium]|jgi:Ala-tRNA(Pro) deacylase